MCNDGVGHLPPISGSTRRPRPLILVTLHGDTMFKAEPRIEDQRVNKALFAVGCLMFARREQTFLLARMMPSRQEGNWQVGANRRNRTAAPSGYPSSAYKASHSHPICRCIDLDCRLTTEVKLMLTALSVRHEARLRHSFSWRSTPRTARACALKKALLFGIFEINRAKKGHFAAPLI